jgi:hypothetical protein
MDVIHIVSGMPHSSTRLVYNLLESSGIFSTPDSKVLNSVKELPMLHAYLTAAANNTPISSDMILGVDDIAFIIESYVGVCGGGSGVLLKMPYYPVVYSEAFNMAARKVGFEPSFVIVERDLNKIRSSYVNRNEDLKYSQPISMLSQINRLPIDLKRKAFVSKGYLDVLEFQYEAFSRAVAEIENKFTVNTASLSALDSYVRKFGPGKIDGKIIDGNRLEHNKMGYVKTIVKNIERKVLEYRIRSY